MNQQGHEYGNGQLRHRPAASGLDRHNTHDQYQGQVQGQGQTQARELEREVYRGNQQVPDSDAPPHSRARAARDGDGSGEHGRGQASVSRQIYMGTLTMTLAATLVISAYSRHHPRSGVVVQGGEAMADGLAPDSAPDSDSRDGATFSDVCPWVVMAVCGFHLLLIKPRENFEYQRYREEGGGGEMEEEDTVHGQWMRSQGFAPQTLSLGWLKRCAGTSTRVLALAYAFASILDSDTGGDGTGGGGGGWLSGSNSFFFLFGGAGIALVSHIFFANDHQHHQLDSLRSTSTWGTHLDTPSYLCITIEILRVMLRYGEGRLG